MSLRAGLLVVGHVDPGSVHVAGDYPQLYQDLLGPHGVEVVPYACDEGVLPASLRECDGWICSPSRLSAYDDVPWLRDVEEVLRAMVAAEVPYIGICFGHQLLAQALGGEVRKAEVGWGVGAQPMDVFEHPWWMTTPVEQVTLLASHQDQVVRLPDGAVRWAGAAYCPNGGMLVGERAWTLQTHPEFVPPLVDHLLAGRVALLGQDTVDRARASLGTPLDRHLVAGWMAATLRSLPHP
jgi:GMP synthase-like glutamine amidotransferase